MANTTVTDALFAANVTQVNAMESSKKAQAEGMSFAQAMGDASLQNRNVAGTSDDMGVKAGSRTTVETTGRDIRHDSKTANDKDSAGAEAQKTDKLENAAKETVKKADAIKDNVKEELGVSDEDIEKAMEVLGLAVQDLFKPEELQKLMMGLAGCEDSLELLTNADLYNGMQEILSTVSEMADTIAEEYGITADDFAQMLDDNGLFEKVIADGQQTGDISFGPIMENEAFQAEVPGITPDHVGVELPQKRDEVETDKEQHINVVVTREDATVAKAESKTETFKNISQTEKSQSNSNEGMESMPQTTTTVTVNNLGDVVETVERFTSAFSDANEIVSQVTETIKLNIAQDTTSMEMMLHPATLGTVNMQISSQNGVITAHILVQNEAVRSALESQLSALLETFEEQGRTVEAVEVSVANYNLDKGMQQNTRDEQERENAFRMGRGARRRLRLDEISDDDMDSLEDDEKLAADMMRRQGNSLDYMA